MSNFWHRFTLWLLRRFRAFRSREERVRLLEERLRTLNTARAGIIYAPRGTARRLELELLYTANLATPLGISVDVLPTVQDADLGPGQMQIRIFEGGRFG